MDRTQGLKVRTQSTRSYVPISTLQNVFREAGHILRIKVSQMTGEVGASYTQSLVILLALATQCTISVSLLHFYLLMTGCLPLRDIVFGMTKFN